MPIAVQDTDDQISAAKAQSDLPQMLVPLKSVKINGVLESGHAVLDVKLSYANLGTD